MTPYNQGFAARKEGLPITGNPYSSEDDGRSFRQWQNGWLDCDDIIYEGGSP